MRRSTEGILYAKPMNRFPTVVVCIVFLTVAWSVSSQDAEEISPVFPLGDPARGRALFEEKQCSRCHTVEGVKFPELDLPAIDFIHIAGENNRGWTRDFYASEIMNPQHLISPDHQKAMLRIGDRLAAENSPMLDFNQNLTVADLIDLVTFLEESAN